MTCHAMPHAILAGLLSVLAGLPIQAQTSGSAATLTAPADRVTDSAIQADQQAYEALQARLKSINDKGRPLRDYHLAKAQCWLDVSLHEYTRNDRGPFPQDALTQAHLLAGALETSPAVPALDTPLIGGAQRLRPDLWDRAAALKGHRGWRCAAQKAACAEVELVHAGHEQAQQGWRHAKPYVQIAEDLLAEAQVLADRCDPPPPPAPAPAAPVVQPPPPGVLPPPPPAAALPRQVELLALVMFDFDRSDEAGLRPESRQQLQAMVQRVQAENLLPRHLQLVGHADRLNGTGQARYNQRLSERRAATVQAVLAKLGLPATGVGLEAQGQSRQLLACQGRHATPALLQACLSPNRRVEVRLITEAAPGR